MTKKRAKASRDERPLLSGGMSLRDFRAFYWMKDELVAFARELDVRATGSKPELTERIERRLSKQGVAGSLKTRQAKKRTPKGRDSDRPITRETKVAAYKSDDRTRAFFEREIGPEFHFTYHLNQFRIARSDLTYGDLVDEWLAERTRRNDPDYESPLAEYGKWNRFVRAFFADEANAGKSLEDAALLWNEAKKGRGDHAYRPAKSGTKTKSLRRRRRR